MTLEIPYYYFAFFAYFKSSRDEFKFKFRKSKILKKYIMIKQAHNFIANRFVLFLRLPLIGNYGCVM